ncbi:MULTISPECIES: BTAD domain-containing putative transcriptional regulator [unclassified Kribbella]|uniref:BTAD domain-containing putative transcriptional regulator n=1 Tax=unclassified Kribbella TaxID=2644121 RepID=UPI0030190CC5
MEFRILGSTEVVDGSRRVDLPAGRGRALLALLILHVGATIPADALIDELWGEHPPPTASTVIQGLISRLRKLLEPDRARGEAGAVVQTAGTGYRLAVDPQSVDANRFQRLFDQARGADPAVRSDLLTEALGLWQGAALADFRYEPFAQRAITALEELRLAAFEERIDADLSLGRHSSLVGELDQLVEANPFRERLRGQLMIALYRSGRQAAALEAYRAARATLVDELGIEPGPALRELEAAILRQEPSLEQPTQAAVPWLPRERRSVTVVVADITVPAAAGIDPEALARFAAQVTDAGTHVLRRHGARVEELADGSLLGYFGLPVAHEDDAVRAVRAALELQPAADNLGTPVRFTTYAGIEAGEVVVGTPAKVSGPVVAAASRLCRSAQPGHVLIGDAAQRLVSGAVVVRRAAVGWEVLELVQSAPAVARQLESRMFGRQQELSSLRTFYRGGLRSGRAAQLTIVGEAGIGKTRLAKEFVESLGSDARVITGRCPAYGEGITFLPLREALESVGLELPEGPAAVLFPAIRRMFEKLAAESPLVVVFEDTHWAETTLLDLIEYVAQSATGPIFLLCLARPELLDRPASGLVLEPLPAADVADLIADRSHGTASEQAIQRIVTTARGNPLFAEQLLATAADSGVDDVPASLQSLLAMRLDRLGPGERDLLRAAAVIGAECGEDAVVALLDEAARPYVERHIAALERKQLLSRSDGIRFRHVLIQRAAYQSMTREDRALLHELYAAWLEAERTTLPELDELVGYHLEQAVAHRRASGVVEAPELAVRAGDRLADAAERAFARFDMTALENLLSRARGLFPADHPRHLVVSQRLAETDLVLGRFDQALHLLDDLIEQADDISDRRSAQLEHARIQFIIGPDPVPLDVIRAEADDAAAYYADAGDDSGCGRAAFLLGVVRLREGRMLAAEQAFRQSLDSADRSGTPREQMGSRWLLAQALALGPTPVAECLEQYEQWATTRGIEHPGVLIESAELLAMLGRFDEARALTDQAAGLLMERMRVRRLLRFVAEGRAVVEMLAGDHVAAERQYRTALDFARETSEREPISLAAAGLSAALMAQDRVKEAAQFAELSVRSAPAAGVMAQARSAAAAAHVASAEGDHAAAERLCRAAVRWAPEEMPNLRGDVLSDLAAVLRDTSAAAVRTEARACYQRKGNTIRMS